LKNLLLLCGPSIAHKPGLIVGVSSGMGGTYPVSELRGFSTKNSKLCFIPDHLILRNVAQLLQGASPEGDIDKQVRERIDYTLQVFFEYNNAFKSMRESSKIDLKLFPYGQ
jgi:hypothetical protein